MLRGEGLLERTCRGTLLKGSQALNWITASTARFSGGQGVGDGGSSAMSFRVMVKAFTSGFRAMYVYE
jgi:hypothetical protein